MDNRADFKKPPLKTIENHLYWDAFVNKLCPPQRTAAQMADWLQPRQKPAFEVSGVWAAPRRTHVVAAACALLCAAVGAQPNADNNATPVHVWADHAQGIAQREVQLRGQAELRQATTTVLADEIDYTLDNSTAHARGDVRIWHAGNAYQGTAGHLQLDTRLGQFEQASYQLISTAHSGHGKAQRVRFEGHDRTVVENALYTTCRRDDATTWADDWQPDWVLRAREVEIDHAEEVGIARGGVLEFKGVPLLPVPAISFPLSDKRKSGLLPPSIGIDSTNGLEYAQPYYWNIAPNYDAVITPTLMARRGLSVSAHARYLLAPWPRAGLGDKALAVGTQTGQFSLSFMPSDKLRQRRDRWSYHWQHGAALHTAAIGTVAFDMQLRRVSDDDYWRDFSAHSSGGGHTGLTDSRLLESVGTLHWATHGHSVLVRAQKWQTLQDDAAPIAAPFGRWPQVQWTFAPRPSQMRGVEVNVQADITRFVAIDRVGSARVRTSHAHNGMRAYTRAVVQRSLQAPWGFLTPALQLHAAHYRLDTPVAAQPRSHHTVVPTFSIDGGLAFERPVQWWGRSALQTLEPRAFYTYTPYRNQSAAPLYDTGLTDFNLASIYSANSYTGHDRIADNHMLTLGVTSRLIAQADGSELARFGIAQRLRFNNQRVSLGYDLPGQRGWSDMLVGLGLNLDKRWSVDTLVQYNQDIRRPVRSSLSARYTPGPFRTLSAAYRYQRINSAGVLSGNQGSEQLELGWQWPLSAAARSWNGQTHTSAAPTGRWYSVGRLNYNMDERKLVDAIMGLEYHSCCWATRVVLERMQTSTTRANTRVLVQLEFSGLSRLNVGANPLSRLQQHVPGYRNTSASARPAPAQWLPPAPRDPY